MGSVLERDEAREESWLILSFDHQVAAEARSPVLDMTLTDMLAEQQKDTMEEDTHAASTSSSNTL